MVEVNLPIDLKRVVSDGSAIGVLLWVKLNLHFTKTKSKVHIDVFSIEIHPDIQ
jgi:hypothetical protein